MTVNVLGIWGPSGSGKSTLVSYLLSHIQATHLNEDDYFQPPPPSTLIHDYDFDQPEALRLTQLNQDLSLLCQGIDITQTPYNMLQRQFNTSRTLHSSQCILIEGRLFPLISNIYTKLSACLYLDTPIEQCMTFRKERDIHKRKRHPEEVMHRINAFVRPSTKQYILPNTHLATCKINPHQKDAYPLILDQCLQIIHTRRSV